MIFKIACKKILLNVENYTLNYYNLDDVTERRSWCLFVNRAARGTSDVIPVDHKNWSHLSLVTNRRYIKSEIISSIIIDTFRLSTKSLFNIHLCMNK